MDPGEVGGEGLLRRRRRMKMRVVVVLRLRRKVGRRAGPGSRVLLVTPIDSTLLAGAQLGPVMLLDLLELLELLDTGDAGQTTAGTAQTKLGSRSGPALSINPGVHRQHRVVSLGETGVQAHFYSRLLSQAEFQAYITHSMI